MATATSTTASSSTTSTSPQTAPAETKGLSKIEQTALLLKTKVAGEHPSSRNRPSGARLARTNTWSSASSALLASSTSPSRPAGLPGMNTKLDIKQMIAAREDPSLSCQKVDMRQVPPLQQTRDAVVSAPIAAAATSAGLVRPQLRKRTTEPLVASPFAAIPGKSGSSNSEARDGARASSSTTAAVETTLRLQQGKGHSSSSSLPLATSGSMTEPTTKSSAIASPSPLPTLSPSSSSSLSSSPLTTKPTNSNSPTNIINNVDPSSKPPIAKASTSTTGDSFLDLFRTKAKKPEESLSDDLLSLQISLKPPTPPLTPLTTTPTKAAGGQETSKRTNNTKHADNNNHGENRTASESKNKKKESKLQTIDATSSTSTSTPPETPGTVMPATTARLTDTPRIDGSKAASSTLFPPPSVLVTATLESGNCNNTNGVESTPKPATTPTPNTERPGGELLKRPSLSNAGRRHTYSAASNLGEQGDSSAPYAPPAHAKVPPINPRLRDIIAPNVPTNLVQARIIQQEEQKRRDAELASIPITANLRSVKKIQAIVVADEEGERSGSGSPSTPTSSASAVLVSSMAPTGKRRGDRNHIEPVAIPKTLVDQVGSILGRKLAGKGSVLDEREQQREEEMMRVVELPPIVLGKPRKRAMTSTHIRNLVSSWDTKVVEAKETTEEAEQIRLFLEQKSHAQAELPKFSKIPVTAAELLAPLPSLPPPPPTSTVQQYGSKTKGSMSKVAAL